MTPKKNRGKDQTVNGKSFFDLTDKEKAKVVKEAVKESNRKQKEFIDNSSHKSEWGPNDVYECSNCGKLHNEAISCPKLNKSEWKELDSIQMDIWAGINDVLTERKVKLKIGDAYCAGSSIKEVLHPRVGALLSSQRQRIVEDLTKWAKEKHSWDYEVGDCIALNDVLEKLKKI